VYEVVGVRIRTDGEFSSREHTIEGASTFYGTNKTQAMLTAAEDAPAAYRALQAVLEDDTLPEDVRRRLAEEFDRRTSWSVAVGTAPVEMDPNP
jgi:hypothetical protein